MNKQGKPVAHEELSHVLDTQFRSERVLCKLVSFLRYSKIKKSTISYSKQGQEGIYVQLDDFWEKRDLLEMHRVLLLEHVQEYSARRA